MGILNVKGSGDQIDDGGETSEEFYKGRVEGEIYYGKDIMECRSDYINGTCVIWCWKIPFWYLVDGDVVLKVTGIWGGSELLRR